MPPITTASEIHVNTLARVLVIALALAPLAPECLADEDVMHLMNTDQKAVVTVPPKKSLTVEVNFIEEGRGMERDIRVFLASAPGAPRVYDFNNYATKDRRWTVKNDTDSVQVYAITGHSKNSYGERVDWHRVPFRLSPVHHNPNDPSNWVFSWEESREVWTSNGTARGPVTYGTIKFVASVTAKVE